MDDLRVNEKLSRIFTLRSVTTYSASTIQLQGLQREVTRILSRCTLSDKAHSRIATQFDKLFSRASSPDNFALNQYYRVAQVLVSRAFHLRDARSLEEIARGMESESVKKIHYLTQSLVDILKFNENWLDSFPEIHRRITEALSRPWLFQYMNLRSAHPLLNWGSSSLRSDFSLAQSQNVLSKESQLFRLQQVIFILSEEKPLYQRDAIAWQLQKQIRLAVEADSRLRHDVYFAASVLLAAQQFEFDGEFYRSLIMDFMKLNFDGSPLFPKTYFRDLRVAVQSELVRLVRSKALPPSFLLETIHDKSTDNGLKLMMISAEHMKDAKIADFVLDQALSTRDVPTRTRCLGLLDQTELNDDQLSKVQTLVNRLSREEAELRFHPTLRSQLESFRMRNPTVTSVAGCLQRVADFLRRN